MGWRTSFARMHLLCLRMCQRPLRDPGQPRPPAADLHRQPVRPRLLGRNPSRPGCRRLHRESAGQLSPHPQPRRGRHATPAQEGSQSRKRLLGISSHPTRGDNECRPGWASRYPGRYQILGRAVPTMWTTGTKSGYLPTITFPGDTFLLRFGLLTSPSERREAYPQLMTRTD